MLAIKDSVHDHIEVEGVAEALIDTPAVQRLRRVAQLGTVTYVYPSANHTRFEHSLGVYHLATRALAHLGVEGLAADRVAAAALLHDIGHGPFSHNVESVVHRHTGKYHDDVEDLVTTGDVGRVLTDHGIDPHDVAGLIRGDGRYGQVVSGELDVDRMDYLVRDAHHTGVPYGTIDHERLVRELAFVDGELVLREGNVQTAESLLLARALMNPTVYAHPVARISKAMLRRAAETLLTAPDISAADLRRMDDHSFVAALRATPETAEYADRLDTRRLFKRALWVEFDDVSEELLDASHTELRRFESDIADHAGVEAADVVVDIPSRPSMTESTSRVVVNGDIRELGKASPLVSALRTSQAQQWRLGVYCPRGVTEQVGRAAVDEFGMDLDGVLVSDIGSGLNATLDEFR